MYYTTKYTMFARERKVIKLILVCVLSIEHNFWSFFYSWSPLSTIRIKSKPKNYFSFSLIRSVRAKRDFHFTSINHIRWIRFTFFPHWIFHNIVFIYSFIKMMMTQTDDQRRINTQESHKKEREKRNPKEITWKYEKLCHMCIVSTLNNLRNHFFPAYEYSLNGSRKKCVGVSWKETEN